MVFEQSDEGNYVYVIRISEMFGVFPSLFLCICTLEFLLQSLIVIK